MFSYTPEAIIYDLQLNNCDTTADVGIADEINIEYNATYSRTVSIVGSRLKIARINVDYFIHGMLTRLDFTGAQRLHTIVIVYKNNDIEDYLDAIEHNLVTNNKYVIISTRYEGLYLPVEY